MGNETTGYVKISSDSRLAKKTEKEIKNEAIKEFANEFEKRCIASGIYPVVTKNILKNLVKEKTEGNDGKS